jgi:hypothetical protein
MVGAESPSHAFGTQTQRLVISSPTTPAGITQPIRVNKTPDTHASFIFAGSFEIN